MSVEFWKAVFDWGTVVLVGLTFIAGAGALITGKILRDRQDAAMTQLTRDTANANERAKQADLKRVELQNRMIDAFGPRSLTPLQSAAIVNHLAGLEGVQVDVLVVDLFDSPNSAEFKDSVSMGRSIQDILTAANFDVEGWIADSCVEGAGAQGLTITVHWGATMADENMAGKILAAFPPTLRFGNKVEHWGAESLCKFSELETTGKPNKRKAGAAKIAIIIGAKTQPVLTREMLEPTGEQ